jgi:hypothetical protein
MELKYIVCLLAVNFSTVAAWGSLGHTTVALIAQNYVSPSAKTWLQARLGSINATYLADVVTWADSYRTTSAGRFSAGFHYLDAEDNPPMACNVDLRRDCGKNGCIVSAIGNYTQRARDTTLSTSQQRDALRFLVHVSCSIQEI